MTPAEFAAAREAAIRHRPDAKPAPPVDLTPKESIDAALKALATGAGIVDLGWLELADLSTVKVNKDGAVEGAAEAVAAFQGAKPHLFRAVSTSSPHTPPSAKVKKNSVMDMSREEYERTKAEMIRANSYRR